MNSSLELQLLAYFSYGKVIGVVLIKLIAAVVLCRVAAGRGNKLSLGLAPWFWGILCLVEPVLTLIAYWLMNHSTLARGVSGDAASDD